MLSIHLPIPVHCNSCCSTNIELTTNDKIYGKIFGAWPKVYICNDCGASCGCHPNTDIPLGRMADRETRQLRVQAHTAFDPLWKNGYMTRTKAYNWLAGQLGIEVSESHISWLSKEQLEKVIETCNDYIKSNRKALERRKAKQNAKQLERERKTVRRIKQRKAGY
jgi:hypothetical protein